jgi:uncharacterized RDD family membrane protein YckC
MQKRATPREPVDTTALVETPEHVRFRYQIAGPAKRGLAYLIDLLIRGGIFLIVVLLSQIFGLGVGDSLSHASVGILLVTLFALEWGYYVLCETLWSGRTPGKRVFQLRVIAETGHPLSFADSLLRNLLRAADFLPGAYALGALVMGSDHRFRRLGDLVAGTIVITEDTHTVSEPLRIDPPPTAKELSAIPQRVPLSGEDLSAIEVFLRRSGRLSVARGNELAELVAPIYARKIGVRYKDPARFLALLYHRAREKKAG